MPRCKMRTYEVEPDACRFLKSEDSILVPSTRAILIVVGYRLRSQGRWSKNWRADYGRTKTTRTRIANSLAAVRLGEIWQFLGGHPRAILFTRLAPRTLDVDDNLNQAFKPVRDQVCCWLAGDNRTNARANDSAKSGYTFSYHQQKQRAYGVQIELRL